MENPLGRLLPAVDAIGDTHPMIGISRQGKGGEFGQMSLNPFDAFPMADMILRHGACMAMNAAEKGLSLDCQEISEFPAHAVFCGGIVLPK